MEIKGKEKKGKEAEKKKRGEQINLFIQEMKLM